MGLLDKVIAAVAPEPSATEREKARMSVRALANNSGWLGMVIDQHEEVEAAFAGVCKAKSASARRIAQKRLAILLSGHSVAEELVIYPAMALADQKNNCGEAFTEQSAAKVQLAALDDIEPMSQDYLDKLEHLRAAISHHVYEEESEWFPRLRRIADTKLQTKLTRPYQEEFDRYVGER